MERYPATYSDERGSERTTIRNDGESLRVSIRGVEFVGQDFTSLGPGGADQEQLGRFTLGKGYLCACRITCRIPVPVQDHDKLHSGVLSVELVLLDPAVCDIRDYDQLRILLEYGGRQYTGPGTSGWFEDELLGIQAQLPEGVFIKACINCLYSDYSPYGHGLFGYLMCFRNLKEEYLRVTSKDEFWSVHGREDRLVQETYICAEFQRRVPGTGYRG
jgi:hypothetical protein